MAETSDTGPPHAGEATRPSWLVARNAAVRSGGEILAKLASVAFFVAIARELGKGGFGDFTFALSLTTVLVLLSGFGTETLITREVARDPSRVHHYLSNVTAVKVTTSFLLLLVAAAIVNIGGYPLDARLAVYFVGIGVAIENFGRTWHAVFQAYQRMEFISLSLIAQRLVTAVAGIAVLSAGGGLVEVSLVFAGGAVIGLLAATIPLRRYIVRPRVAFDRREWLPVIKAGMPIGLSILLFTALLRVDATMLSFLSGGNNQLVGIYGAAFRLVEATMFLSWSIGAAMLPWLARHRTDRASGLASGYELGLMTTTAVLLPIGLGFTLLAPSLINLLYGHGFAGAVTPLRLLGPLTCLYGINYFAGTALVARDRAGEFTRILAVVVAQNVVFNLVLIPLYGADGAALNATLSGVLLAVLGLWHARQAFGRINLMRAFGGPLVGGAAMAAVILPANMPLLPAVLAGGVAYVAGLLAFERLVFSEDVRMFVHLFRVRGRPSGPPGTPRPEPGPPGIGFDT